MDNSEYVCDVVWATRHIPVDEVGAHLHISHGSAHEITHDKPWLLLSLCATCSKTAYRKTQMSLFGSLSATFESVLWPRWCLLKMRHYWKQNNDPALSAGEQTPKFETETSHITSQDDGQDTSNTRKSNVYTFLGCTGDKSGIFCREGFNSKECSLLSNAAGHTEASNSQQMPKIMVGSCSVAALPTLCSHTAETLH